MSRSYKKKNIAKVRGHLKDQYWKQTRRSVKNFIRSKDVEELDNEVLPDEKEIINDYNYIDYVSNCEGEPNCYCKRNYGRYKCKEK